MFRSQLFYHPQGVVLRASAITTFSACLRRLFDMWLYVVYVCACLMYLSMGCLVVHNQTSHRQVHQARTHIDNIQPHTKQVHQARTHIDNIQPHTK